MLPRTLSEVVIVPTSYYSGEVMSMKQISAGMGKLHVILLRLSLHRYAGQR